MQGWKFAHQVLTPKAGGNIDGLACHASSPKNRSLDEQCWIICKTRGVINQVSVCKQTNVEAMILTLKLRGGLYQLIFLSFVYYVPLVNCGVAVWSLAWGAMSACNVQGAQLQLNLHKTNLKVCCSSSNQTDRL